MPHNLPHLLSRMVNTPLLAHPRKAAVVYNVLSRSQSLPLPETPDAALVDALRNRGAMSLNHLINGPQASRFEGDLIPNGTGGQFPRIEPFRFRDGAAVVSVTGSLVNRGAWVGDDGSGVYSYEGISFQLQRAARDRRVQSILLDLESPGGEATGAFEIAALVRKINAEKPVYTIVNGMAASAGYAIASGSKRIFTTGSGVSGSIGVVLLHLDQSKALEEKGVTPTLIFAGDHKVDGNPFEPLSDSVKADLQREVMSFYQLFLDTVSEGRGRRMSRKAAKDTQGRTYIGQEAVDVGLADGVGTFEELLAEVTRRNTRSAGSKSNRSATKMSIQLDDEQGNTPAAITQANVDAARAEGVTEGRKAGAEAERERINAILSHDKLKGHSAFALKMACKFPTASADDVAEMAEAAGLGDAPKAGASTNIPNLRERSAETGVEDLATDSAPDKATAEQEAVRGGWKAAVDGANKSTRATLDRRAAR